MKEKEKIITSHFFRSATLVILKDELDDWTIKYVPPDKKTKIMKYIFEKKFVDKNDE